MFVICPLSNCAGPDQRDRFLEFISKIATVTQDSEAKCRAYAWFRSAGDNDIVPGHWLRGFEIYDDAEANSVTHRASAPYKAFRLAVGEESLLERPSDLRFWRPTGIGFLTRGDPINFSLKDRTDTPQYIVTDELHPGSSLKAAVMGQLIKLAKAAEAAIQPTSFWILERGTDDEEGELYVFSRFDSKPAWETFEADGVKDLWEDIKMVCQWTRRTTWVDAGMGFIGR